MKNIDSTYVAIGASWLLLGMTLGIVMGATKTFNLCPFTLTSISSGSLVMQYSEWLTGIGRR